MVVEIETSKGWKESEIKDNDNWTIVDDVEHVLSI